MRDRDSFVREAACFSLQSAHNATERKERAQDAKATAEALADLFGLEEETRHHMMTLDAGELARVREERARFAERSLAAENKLAELEATGVTRARVEELEQLGATNAKRIADLEAELAAARAGKAARR